MNLRTLVRLDRLSFHLFSYTYSAEWECGDIYAGILALDRHQEVSRTPGSMGEHYFTTTTTTTPLLHYYYS